MRHVRKAVRQGQRISLSQVGKPVHEEMSSANQKISMSVPSSPTYHTNALAKKRAIGKREQHVDATLERFHRLAVLSSEFADALCLLLKQGGDGPDRVASFELLGERVFGQFCPGLPFIVSQGGVEEGLEMRGPGWENHLRAAQSGRWNWKNCTLPSAQALYL